MFNLHFPRDNYRQKSPSADFNIDDTVLHLQIFDGLVNCQAFLSTRDNANI